jgi:hypothetical protein
MSEMIETSCHPEHARISPRVHPRQIEPGASFTSLLEKEATMKCQTSHDRWTMWLTNTLLNQVRTQRTICLLAGETTRYLLELLFELDT